MEDLRVTRAARLRALWAELNVEHFDGQLTPIPIRVTRSRRTYGYFNGPNNRGSASIRISSVLADAENNLRDTMLHEMIHQMLYEIGYEKWDEHGNIFQYHHIRLIGEPYVEP